MGSLKSSIKISRVRHRMSFKYCGYALGIAPWIAFIGISLHNLPNHPLVCQNLLHNPLISWSMQVFSVSQKIFCPPQNHAANAVNTTSSLSAPPG